MQKSINIEVLESVEIPLSPLAELARIVAVCSLIPAFGAKIQCVLARIWGNGLWSYYHHDCRRT